MHSEAIRGTPEALAEVNRISNTATRLHCATFGVSSFERPSNGGDDGMIQGWLNASIPLGSHELSFLQLFVARKFMRFHEKYADMQNA